MASKPTKSATDYMAIAACPALIMVLVGSLIFFLLQIGYAGEAAGRLRWTLFWFVLAMVLVSRIAIEQSRRAALVYGLALGGATSLLLNQYLGFHWGVWLLLGLIWWACDKIVWDSTLIDEDQDASGQGLLQTRRLQRWAGSPLSKVRAVPTPDSALSHSHTTSSPSSVPHSPIATPHSALGTLQWRTPRPRVPVSHSAPRAPHSPGLWVLYFSFAAVPVFGLGELFLTSGDLGARRFCFVLLLAYLASALGLLLLTSFVGLRRYLRQRYLVMPGEVAGSWVTTGLGLLVAVLILALLLPRPATPYSLANLLPKLSSPPQKASKYSPSQSTGAEGRSSARSPRDRDAQPLENGAGQNQPAPGLKSGGESGGKSPTQQIGPNSRAPAPRLALRLEKWLSWLLAAIIAAVLIYRGWPMIRAGLNSVLEVLKGLWPSGKPRKGPKRQRASSAAQEPEPIHLLPNPFHTGQAERLSLAELVCYSYDGLRRWAQSRGFALDESETPLELAERLAQREPTLSNEVLLVSSYYAHVAYGNQLPTEECLIVLKRLWSVIGVGRG